MLQLICFITLLHENGCISLNNGPILKIQNLAYSGEEAQYGKSEKSVAHDATREMTSRARRNRHHHGNNHFVLCGSFGPLPWAYLANRLVDFAYFWQAN